MYRLGIGDCFLLSFPRDGGEAFRMLIDCGVHSAQSGGAETIRKVVDDIRAETGGKIDVIVATHEHWDHISGFAQAADLFKTMTVDEVWLAWTEDKDDALARSLVEKRHHAIAALKQAEVRLTLAGAPDARLSGLLGFFDPRTGPKLSDAGAALKNLPRQPIRFHRPGEDPFELPGVDARIFVLGPPRDRALIARDKPRKSADEV